MNGEPTQIPPLAEGEEHFLIDGPRPAMRLFLRRLGPTNGPGARSVLYVHGATFPSALSVAHRFDGRSWRDALCDAGINVWSLDFYGFGHSDRYPEMDNPADAHEPLGTAAECAEQIACAVRFILARENQGTLSLIAHSWGDMPTGLFAGAHAALVDRLVFFAPITRREPSRYVPCPSGPAWKLVTAQDQWDRFVEDVPPDEPPVLLKRHFDDWAGRYLETDPESEQRTPPAVKIPNGPFVEILRAWHGRLGFDPGKIQAPVAIIRGAWDGLVTDGDARWLFEALSRSPSKRDIKISRATHLMHLEEMRAALWHESIGFLLGDDVSSNSPQTPPTEPERQTNMPDESKPKEAPNIPGYNPGSPEVAKSPISMEELQELKASAFFNDEDIVYLRLSYDVLKDQAEDLVTMWRGIIAQHTHLTYYSKNPQTGEPDEEYGKRVGKRFAQWVLDTAKAEYDQTWLDYQYEIGLRHHRAKKNQTDGAHTAAHIRGRDLIAFAAATVAPMRPYLEKGGHSADVVLRMQEAWWKSMILQVTLWSQPYMNHGDF